MKADIHPDYVLAHVTLLVRKRVLDALDEAGAPRRDLRRVPPVLHGQAEARRHRRSGRALPAPAREGRRAAAPRLARHGRQLRRAGRSRGRDDAQPVDTGPSRSARRTGEITRGRPGHRLADGSAAGSGGCRSIRGVIALGESLAIGFRALADLRERTPRRSARRGRRDPDARSARGQIIFSFAIAIGFALMLFKVGARALITSWLPIDVDGLVRDRRGR